EPLPQLVLQPADGLADRGLGAVQLGGRPGEAALGGDGQKYLQLGQFHAEFPGAADAWTTADRHNPQLSKGKNYRLDCILTATPESRGPEDTWESTASRSSIRPCATASRRPGFRCASRRSCRWRGSSTRWGSTSSRRASPSPPRRTPRRCRSL